MKKEKNSKNYTKIVKDIRCCTNYNKIMILVKTVINGERVFIMENGMQAGFATVPAEIFDTTGKQIREGSPTEITFVLTVTNGRHTYIPPAEVFNYSSSGVVPYEVRICKYPRGTAETLAQDLINMLTELQG